MSEVWRVISKAAVMVACGCATMASGKAPDDGLYFHATFDQTRIATRAGQDVAMMNRMPMKYEQGPVNDAILVPGGSGLVYRTGDGFPLKQGTLAFWLKPNFDYRDKDFKYQPVFLKLTDFAYPSSIPNHAGPRNGLRALFFNYNEPHQMFNFMLCDGEKVANHSKVEVPEPDWKPGQWRHFAGTWGPKGVRMFLDGKCVAESPSTFFPTENARIFRLGGQSPTWGSMWADDLRIYDRPLGDGEIKALFDLGENVEGLSTQKAVAKEEDDDEEEME